MAGQIAGLVRQEGTCKEIIEEIVGSATKLLKWEDAETVSGK